MITIARWLLPLLMIFTGVPAAVVTRGPYLQSGTPTSMSVRWRTDVPAGSRVNYGPAPGSLNSSISAAGSSTEHEIKITNLTPFTTYYYAVGDGAGMLAGGDSSFYFKTSPNPRAVQPVRIWVIGDAGTADDNQKAVRDAYYALAGPSHTDVWLQLGDNAYGSGTDSEYQRAVFDIYPHLLRKSVTWPTRGNHEVSAADYYGAFTLPANGEAGGVASGTEAYYAFDYANIHFVCLESYTENRAITGPMLTWLKNDLGANQQDWLIAFWHHPPYSKGSHNSDSDAELVEMRENALPILESYGVDLVLCGHSHSYERSMLVDGFYGLSSGFNVSLHAKDAGDGQRGGDGPYQKGPGPHNGTVYAVAGSSGKISGGALDHPIMVASLNSLGSLVLDVKGDTLDGRFLRENGAIADSFTIRHSSPTALSLRPLPASAAGLRLAPNPLTGKARILLPPEMQNGRISVYNMQGFRILQRPIREGRVSDWNIQGVPAGVYLVRAEANGKRLEGRLSVVQ